MTTLTRRELLKAGGTIAGLQLLAPIAFRAGEAYAATSPDPATQNRLRLVLIDLAGGNDGLNTVVPKSGTLRDIYEKVRNTTELPAGPLLSLGQTNGGEVGLNAELKTVYNLWQQQRVAVVQGVDYPNHNYSHFISDDIWQSGEPGITPDSGWLGRHLDRVGIGTAELRAVGIGYDRLPLALRGFGKFGEEINWLSETQFLDGTGTVAQRRHTAYAGYDAATDPLGNHYGKLCRNALELSERTAGLTAANPGGLSSRLLTARTLLSNNLGVEVVIVNYGGFDTHENQATLHRDRMIELDRAIEAFFYGTHDGTAVTLNGSPVGPLSPALTERTLVMTFSEFGRRIGDNGSGTDHGAAAPLFLIGPPQPAAGSGKVKLNPGLFGDHPGMGTVTLPADNLVRTTDVRNVYQSVLLNWINDPTGPSPEQGDPLFANVTGTGSVDPYGGVAGLFGVA